MVCSIFLEVHLENRTAEHQLLKMTDRARLELNGVESVAEFDENYVALDTSFGRMYIEGENLRIVDLSEESGKILISGVINEISYQENKSKRKKSIFK